jgi:4-hydroxybenzoate polyprenyltransferase
MTPEPNRGDPVSAPAATDTRPQAQIGDYIAIARPDHWIKHVMIVPGIVFAWLLAPSGHQLSDQTWINIILGFAAACMISSANYVINEWLDAPFDAQHPKKQSRPAVRTAMDPVVVYGFYIALILAGLAFGWMVGWMFFLTTAVFAFAGFLYNVRPFRTKDLPFLDVISESFNNPLRLLLGWFMIAPTHLPPASLLLAYWAGGAFLMTVKRFAEHRFLSDGSAGTVARYRPSLAGYKDSTLIIAALIYAQLFAFMMAVFLLKYRAEYILLFPPLCVLFAIYMRIGYSSDSAAQSPEKLFKQPLLLGLAFGIVALFLALTFIDMPGLTVFTDPLLIPIGN